MEWFNCKVGDRSKVVGGAQRIETPDGYVFPLSIESGWVYMHSNQVPTDDNLQQYGIFFFRTPDIWDASVLDHGITPALLGEIHQEADDSPLKDSMFDEFGELHLRVVQHLEVFWDPSHIETGDYPFHAHLHKSNPAEDNWKSLRPYFGWQSEQVIQDTYKVTSTFGGTVPQHDYLKKHFKSRNPGFNIPRRNETVPTDIGFSDAPAINDGSIMAQFCVGKNT